MRIGVVSDTHGWIHPDIYKFFAPCDEIWHAGDIGSIETANALNAFRPLKAVYGNIDDLAIRRVYGKNLRIEVGSKRILITHIGGTPGHYVQDAAREIELYRPDVFICGHSHITLVKYDRKYGHLHINPGAAGYKGIHKTMTAVRFVFKGGKIDDFEVVNFGERGKVEPTNEG